MIIANQYLKAIVRADFMQNARQQLSAACAGIAVDLRTVWDRRHGEKKTEVNLTSDS